MQLPQGEHIGFRAVSSSLLPSGPFSYGIWTGFWQALTGAEDVRENKGRGSNYRMPRTFLAEPERPGDRLTRWSPSEGIEYSGIQPERG
jgi:hypothetical protein